MSIHQSEELEHYQKYKAAYIRAFDRMLKRRESENMKDKTDVWGSDAESIYKWWIEKGV